MTKAEFREFAYWSATASNSELEQKPIELTVLKTTLSEEFTLRGAECMIRNVRFEIRTRREVAELENSRKAA